MNSFNAELLAAYFNLLDGNIFYAGLPVNIYINGVDANDKYHYIQLRMESESDQSNKNYFVTHPILVADVCSFHEGSIDGSVVEEIDNQLRSLLFPTRKGIQIQTADYQVLNVKLETSTYLEGFNGARHEHRKVSRFSNRINQN